MINEEIRLKLRLSHLGQKSWNKGKKCPHLWGDKHHNWKGGKYKSPNGYIKLQINGLSILEHRYVMSNHIGRKLNKKEVVHHINGNPSDNRIENLKLIKNNSEHMKLHRWDLNGKETVKCKNCKCNFVNFKSNKRIFCSKKCYSNAQKGKKYETSR